MKRKDKNTEQQNTFNNGVLNKFFRLLTYACYEKIDFELMNYDFSDAEIEAFYRISLAHDLSHIIAVALKQNKNYIEGSDISQNFQKRCAFAVLRHEMMNLEYMRICSILEKERIAFVPLKGAVLKKYYPKPWMRTSCDIDILVKKEDVERASTLLVKQYNYREGEKSGHDISLFSQNNVQIELHFSLIESERIGKVDRPLSKIWDKVNLVEGKGYQYDMPDDYYYYYHIAHAAKHFLIGGCGIRPVLDVYILNHFVEYNKRERVQLLKSGGLDRFSAQIENLSEVWFGDYMHNKITQNMQDYIVRGGVYGTVTNSVIVEQTKNGGNRSYIFSRIWMPYEKLKFAYPNLDGKRWLTFFYQVKRWVGLIFGGKLRRSLKELKISTNVPEEKLRATQDLLEQLGL